MNDQYCRGRQRDVKEMKRKEGKEKKERGSRETGTAAQVKRKKKRKMISSSSTAAHQRRAVPQRQTRQTHGYKKVALISLV
jgi:hypothetical protein